MLGAAIVKTQAAMLRPDQMRRHIERGIGERPAEMAGLGIIAHQHHGHACQEADIFQPRTLLRIGRHP